MTKAEYLLELDRLVAINVFGHEVFSLGEDCPVLGEKINKYLTINLQKYSGSYDGLRQMILFVDARPCSFWELGRFEMKKINYYCKLGWYGDNEKRYFGSAAWETDAPLAFSLALLEALGVKVPDLQG